jgi:hypothetical protein
VPVVDKDYIVRVVKQIGDLFARLLKLIERQEYEQAIRALHSACPGLLGLDWEPLTFSDAETAAKLLVEREKVKIFAQLVSKEAEILELKGDASANDKRRFALELWAEAVLRGAPLSPEQSALVRGLTERVGASVVGERYAAALAKAVPSPAGGRGSG